MNHVKCFSFKQCDILSISQEFYFDLDVNNVHDLFPYCNSSSFVIFRYVDFCGLLFSFYLVQDKFYGKTFEMFVFSLNSTRSMWFIADVELSCNAIIIIIMQHVTERTAIQNQYSHSQCTLMTSSFFSSLYPIRFKHILEDMQQIRRRPSVELSAETIVS